MHLRPDVIISAQSQLHIINRSSPNQQKHNKNIGKNGFFVQKYGECMAVNYNSDFHFCQMSAAKILLCMVSIRLTLTFVAGKVMWFICVYLHKLRYDILHSQTGDILGEISETETNLGDISERTLSSSQKVFLKVTWSLRTKWVSCSSLEF